MEDTRLAWHVAVVATVTRVLLSSRVANSLLLNKNRYIHLEMVQCHHENTT